MTAIMPRVAGALTLLSLSSDCVFGDTQSVASLSSSPNPVELKHSDIGKSEESVELLRPGSLKDEANRVASLKYKANRAAVLKDKASQVLGMNKKQIPITSKIDLPLDECSMTTDAENQYCYQSYRWNEIDDQLTQPRGTFMTDLANANRLQVLLAEHYLATSSVPKKALDWFGSLNKMRVGWKDWMDAPRDTLSDWFGRSDDSPRAIAERELVRK